MRFVVHFRSFGHVARRRSLRETACHTLFLRHFCEALFEVQPDYKHANFRHAIMCADNVDMIQKKMGIVKGINLGKEQKVHCTIYSAAIQRAQQLGEYAECWRLYHEAKYHSTVDIVMLTQMINITSNFVENRFVFDVDRRNSKMYSKSKSALEVAKHKMLSRVHRLYGEMRHELQLQPTPTTFASLITACSKFNSFLGADRYWELYCREFGDDRHEEVYAAIIFSKVTKTDMVSAMRLFDEMTTVYHIVPNARIISKLLSGFARLIRMRSTKQSKFREVSDFLTESETLMRLYFQICLVHDRSPEIDIFNGICNVYASSGDITSCFDILHCLLDGTLPPHFSVNGTALSAPSPNTFTFNTCLKSLVYCLELHDGQKQNVWRLVDFLLTKMQEMDINRDCTTYSTLFHLCGNSNVMEIKPDLDRAVAYFAELSNAVPVIEISKKCMHSLLLTGLQYYDYCYAVEGGEDAQKRHKYEFIEWWLAEAKEYRIPCTLSIHELCDIKAHKFRIPK